MYEDGVGDATVKYDTASKRACLVTRATTISLCAYFKYDIYIKRDDYARMSLFFYKIVQNLANSKKLMTSHSIKHPYIIIRKSVLNT